MWCTGTRLKIDIISIMISIGAVIGLFDLLESEVFSNLNEAP